MNTVTSQRRRNNEQRNQPPNANNRVNGIGNTHYTENGSSTVWGSIYGTNVNLLFDSGAVTILMDEDVYRLKKKQIGKLRRSKRSLAGVSGCDLVILGEADVVITIDGVALPTRVKVGRNLSNDVIIGREFMDNYKVNILFESNLIYIKQAK